jgi:uncharacterized membrane protein YjfL (UPF0719 family)
MSALIGVHAKDELDKKDNFAFGVVIAGAALALTLIMSGAVSGVAQASLVNEALNVLMYGAVGIALLKLGYLIQDKLLLRGISIGDEIKQGNVAAAVVAAINLVALGIIIRTSITWVDDDGVSGLLPVLLVFISSQIVLAAVTTMRTLVYRKRNNGGSWQEAIHNGNIALSFRFAGQMLATALALSSVAYIVNYSATQLFEIAIAWLGLGVTVMVVVWIIYRLAYPIVLNKVNIVEEVDKQQNIGVAAVEAALFVGIASLLMGFMA